ncbi:hypothetical protein E3E38_05595 [Thermococcus sp. 18S1]|uniref:DUF257 family protein n=1 Tax=Thermococcus sp. 18S1 TaxID=1638210 RepID=UPI00143BFF54|nr:DUF257 family protein [Thermococcus sp. 18S1]NJE30523.1 hypothetical protein [Thermococcus sp. 18S1]
MEQLEELFRVIDTVQPGESVLVKYHPSYAPEFLVLLLMEYGRKRNVPIIIDDNFDSLHVLQEHLRFWGIEEDFSDALVVKSGGRINVGNVIANVEFSSEPLVYIKKYEETMKNALAEINDSINIALGLERLFAFIHSPREYYLFITELQKMLGNTKRKAAYLMNTEVASTLEFNPLPELEYIASTVVEITPTPISAKVTFLKTPVRELLGREYEVSLEVMLDAFHGKGL